MLKYLKIFRLWFKSMDLYWRLGWSPFSRIQQIRIVGTCRSKLLLLFLRNFRQNEMKTFFFFHIFVGLKILLCLRKPKMESNYWIYFSRITNRSIFLEWQIWKTGSNKSKLIYFEFPAKIWIKNFQNVF